MDNDNNNKDDDIDRAFDEADVMAGDGGYDAMFGDMKAQQEAAQKRELRAFVFSTTMAHIDKLEDEEDLFGFMAAAVYFIDGEGGENE